jgi:hypothetical protein
MVGGGGTLVYDNAAIWLISTLWLALTWLIVFATVSAMVAVCTPVMVLPVVNAAMFIVVVSVVSVLSSLVNRLYILWDSGT